MAEINLKLIPDNLRTEGYSQLYERLCTRLARLRDLERAVASLRITVEEPGGGLRSVEFIPKIPVSMERLGV